MTAARRGGCLAAVAIAAAVLPSWPVVPDALADVPAAAAAPTDTAPGLSVSGNQLLRDGAPFLARGFNMVALLTPDWCTKSATQGARAHFGQAELDAAQAWHATTLRFQVSQRGLADPAVAPEDRGAYLQEVRDGVALARGSGFTVVLSMQDQALGCGAVHPLPSALTEAAWDALAPAFTDDTDVAFELFNEPRNDATAAGWAQWRDGGSSPDTNLGDPAVGQQELVDHLRGLGAPNVLIVDGARLGEQTAGIPLLSDPAGDLVYGIHPYVYTQGPAYWDQQYGALAAVAPVLATEWNYLAGGCGGAKERLAPALLDYLRDHGIGVLGHAFDSLHTTVADWNWTPTRCGTKAGGGSGAVLQSFFAQLAATGWPPVPDTTAPSAPARLTVRVVGPAQVALSWPAATDDVGVTGYRVSRDGQLLTTVTGLTATDSTPLTGSHQYAVQAFDAAGNTSPPVTATAVVPAPAASGLTGTYFDTATLTTQKLVRVDRTVAFTWGTGSPAKGIGGDTFSVRWTGRVLPTADGAWTFTTQSDEGARLWIDGTLLIDNWTAHPLTTKNGTVTLSANQAHDLRLEYYDKTGTATMRLLWSGPGTTTQVIPATHLLAA